MEQRELTVVKRTALGKEAAIKLRRAGLVPAILYGRGAEPTPLSVEAKALRALIHELGHNAIVRLTIADAQGENPTVMMREIQRHPLSGVLLNVDFQHISLTEKITVAVPVLLVGEALGAKRGGMLDHMLREVEVEALPTALPDHIELDITDLQLGHALHVSDLAAPAGVTIVNEATDVVVSLTAPRAVEAAATAAEGAEGAAEGEEAAGEAEEE